MQIWHDTIQADSPSFTSAECGTTECMPDEPRSFCTNLPLTADSIGHVNTLLLEQTRPLHVQKCAPERWLACNPTGSGRIVVLDAEAMSLLEQFGTARSTCEVLPIAANAHPERVARAVTLLYSVGLLRDSATSPMISGQEETDTLTAWLHVTNACNLRCQYCYLDKTSENMTQDTAFHATDAVFRSASRHHYKQVLLKYAGGEASLHMARVLTIHDYALQLARQTDITLRASILSNGIVLSQRTINNLKTRDIGVMISLDGLGYYHDLQRPFIHGKSTFKYIDRTINLLLTNELVPHISVTVSQRNLDGLTELLMYILERRLTFTLSYYRDNDCATGRDQLQFAEQQMIKAMRSAFSVIERHLPEHSLLGSLIDKANLHYPHQHNCNVGQSYLVVDQNGGIAKCHANIKQTVTTIDANDPLQVVRDDLAGVQNLPVDQKEGCRVCDWRYWCAGGCPLLAHRVTGRYDVKSPNCHIYQALFPEALHLEALRLLKYVTPSIL